MKVSLNYTSKAGFILGVLLAVARCLSAQQTPAPPGEGSKPMRYGAIAPTPLRELLQEAEKNNPEIVAAGHGWKAAAHGVAAATALPDTQISVQSLSVGSPRPLAGFSHSDFAYLGLGASQEIPYPGKRKLRGQVAEREADSQHQQAEALRRQVMEKVKTAYFQLAYLQQMIVILGQNDRALDDVEKIAESHYRVGQGTQQDVLKAQLQHTKILEEITMHHRDEGELQAELKQLLGRRQDSADLGAEPLALHGLTYTAAQLLQAVADRNPEVQVRTAMLRKAEAQMDVSKREFLPDFNLQYMFQRTGSSFPAYYVATFGINVPNWGRRKAELAQATERREQANAELAAEMQRQMAEVQRQYVLAQTSEQQLKIYRDGLIPQADVTFRSALAAYQSNRQDFATLLASFLDSLSLNLEYQRELATHESALARIETLTGVTTQ